MGKGGDKSTASTTSELGTFAQPYYEDLIKRTQQTSQQGYTPYNGQRLANFSGDTNQAFQMIRNQAAAGTGGLDAAQQVAAGVGNYTPQGIAAANVDAGANYNPTSVADADLSGYMNQYTSNVLDVNKDKALRRYQEQQATRDTNAVKAGAFGGDRRFVSDSLAQRDLNEQLDTMNAEAMAAAYDRATGLYQDDEKLRYDAFTTGANRRATVDTANADRGLSAAIADEEARRLGGSLRLDAAKSAADMAQQWQDMGFRNAEALSGVGAKIQQREQAGLDLAYNDFTKQRDWGKENLNFYAGILNGAPIQPNTETTQEEAKPDFLSQLLGLGTAAFGAFS